MRKIIDYQILYSSNFPDLVREVKEKIKLGWQPQGGVQANEIFENKRIYRSLASQAIVKYEEE